LETKFQNKKYDNPLETLQALPRRVLPEPMSMVYEEREDETEDGMGKEKLKR